MQEIAALFRALCFKIFSRVIAKIPIILFLNMCILSKLAHMKFIS